MISLPWWWWWWIGGGGGGGGGDCVDDGVGVQIAPEERRPVTEDGEATSTHETVRTHEEEVFIL